MYLLVQVEQQSNARPVMEEQGGIVGALAKALASRSAQIQGSGTLIHSSWGLSPGFAFVCDIMQ